MSVVDRLNAPVNPKVAWRRALTLLAACGIACALVGVLTGRAANAGFVAFPIAFAMVLVWTYRMVRKRNFIDADQLEQIGASGAPSERTLVGMIAALPDGVGVTHRPMTDLYVRFDEIVGITIERSMEHLKITGFTPDFVPRRAGPWNCATMMICTNRDDYPVIPVPFDSKRAAKRWFAYVESGGVNNLKLPAIPLGLRSFLRILLIVVVSGMAFMPLAGLFLGPDKLFDHSLWTLFYVFMGVEAVTSVFSTSLSSGAEVVCQVLLHSPLDRSRVEISTWDSVDMIEYQLVQSISIELKKPDWISRPLFTKATLTDAALTFTFNRDHDRTRELTMKIEEARELILEISKSNPDVEIFGTDLREIQLENVYAPNHTRSEA